MKNTWRYFPFLAVAIVISCAFPGCEDGAIGPALGITPSGVLLGRNAGYVILEVTSGTTEGSFPLEWRAEDPNLGRAVSNGRVTATYARFNPNGRNRVIVRDQHGVEGIAVISQVDYAPLPGTTYTTTTTGTTSTTIPDPQSSNTASRARAAYMRQHHGVKP